MYRILAGNVKGETWAWVQCDTKIRVKEAGCKIMDWINLA